MLKVLKSIIFRYQLETTKQHVATEKILLGKKLRNNKALYLETVARPCHLQIIGDGKEKSKLARTLAVQDILADKRPVIFLTPTSESIKELYEKTINAGNKVYYIDFLEPSNVVINPLGFDDIELVQKINLEIYQTSSAKIDRKKLTEQLKAFSMAIMVVKELQEQNATYIDIWELLKPQNHEHRIGTLDRLKSTSLKEELKEYIQKWKNEEVKNRSSEIYKELLNYLKTLVTERRVKEFLCGNNGISTLNLIDFLNSRDTLLISTGYNDLNYESHNLLNHLIYSLLTMMMMRANWLIRNMEEFSKKPITSFYVDEFDQYISNNPGNNYLLYQRGHKFKVMFTVTFSSLQQIALKVPIKSARFVNTEMRYKIIFHQSDFKNAEKLSEFINKVYNEHQINKPPLELTAESFVTLRHDEAFFVTSNDERWEKIRVLD